MHLAPELGFGISGYAWVMDAYSLAFTATGDTLTWLPQADVDTLLTLKPSGNVDDSLARMQLGRALGRLDALTEHLHHARQETVEHQQLALAVDRADPGYFVGGGRWCCCAALVGRARWTARGWGEAHGGCGGADWYADGSVDRIWVESPAGAGLASFGRRYWVASAGERREYVRDAW